MRKPERDIVMEGQINDEYEFKLNDQVNELKCVLAQDDITIDIDILSKALKYPTFTWENSTCKTPQYPNCGVGLMNNPYPKVKKAKKVKKKKKH